MQLVVLRASGDNPFQNVCQPSFWIEGVEFCSGDERREDRPGLATAGVATEQAIRPRRRRLFPSLFWTRRALQARRRASRL